MFKEHKVKVEWEDSYCFLVYELVEKWFRVLFLCFCTKWIHETCNSQTELKWRHLFPLPCTFRNALYTYLVSVQQERKAWRPGPFQFLIVENLFSSSHNMMTVFLRDKWESPSGFNSREGRKPAEPQKQAEAGEQRRLLREGFEPTLNTFYESVQEFTHSDKKIICWWGRLSWTVLWLTCLGGADVKTRTFSST